MGFLRDVRFPPDSDRTADIPDWLLRARGGNRGLTRSPHRRCLL